MGRRLVAWAALAVAAISSSWAQDVEGRVVEDSAGNPLASAELKFHKSGMRELAADLETDRDGRFHVSGLAAGEYTVDVSKPNFVTTALKLRVPAAGLQLRLVRLAVISGQVRDTGGKPVLGRTLEAGGRTHGSARVAVLVKRPGTGDEMEAVRTTSLEEGGRYRVSDLPPGQYAVGLWWAGLDVGSGAQLYPDNTHPRYFTVSGGEEYRNIDFLVVSGAAFSVSGKVELPKPKTSFAVALGLPAQPTLPIAQGVTEDDGTFRFSKVPPGTYELFASGPTAGYGAFESVLGKDTMFGRMTIQVVGQDLTGVSVPVSAGRSVEVVLRAQGNKPRPAGCPQSATVTPQLLEPWGILGGSGAQAGFDKPQTIRDLAPARYRLTASGLGSGCYQVNRPVVDLNAAPAGPAAIEVAPAGEIRGTLRGGAVGFTVVLVDAEASDNADARIASPDDQGHFIFDGLRPGRYRIAAHPAGDAAGSRWVDMARMVEIDVPGGVPTDVDLPVSAGGGK